ncbi:uncharacterized protein DNG_01779 [Cephalotrichum gorgonifer]|uniref:Fungal lipase-type domain-containing protein n=1 Tax=Cephalotrichum gorgonifer TaxID=2041049 RepID=A0AAE8SS41_9PEZI|nr:uncharacterized protein DNG_01779 [Cephalotrichum gorgonifer]
MAFLPAGYLPAPPGWTPSAQCPSGQGQAPPPYNSQYQPIVVNQYYLHPPPGAAAAAAATRAKKSTGALNKLGGSMAYLANDLGGDFIPQIYNESLTAWQTYGTQVINQTAAVADQVSSSLNHIMTMIDGERIAGNEMDLFTYRPPAVAHTHPPSRPVDRPPGSRAKKGDKGDKGHTKGQTSAVAAAVVSGGYFSKVDMYTNSRLPRDLPPLKLYVSTWPLICTAAGYSERVYATPKGGEKDTHVSANWRGGTRAMVIKSVSIDDKSVIVFAIRGTATFMDWAVNLNMEPTSPVGFLDDPGNLCHAGFLSSAKSMVRPVAARLRQLLKDQPGRSNYSLLITGHSAGGAVGALLYSHMHSASRTAQSELSLLAGSFKRIHCITFGAPPVSLLPLTKADAPQLRKSVFMNFINEGDPVARADKAYVKSLIELLASPDPSPKNGEKERKSAPDKAVRKEKSRRFYPSLTQPSPNSSGEGSRGHWKVPDCTLSLAGRIVVLRSGSARRGREKGEKGEKGVEERMRDGVVAQTAVDGDIRGVIWGDPVCHVMRFYSRRVEALAVEAITAKR